MERDASFDDDTALRIIETGTLIFLCVTFLFSGCREKEMKTLFGTWLEFAVCMGRKEMVLCLGKSHR